MTRSSSLYLLSSNYLQALDFLTDPELNLPIEAVNDTLEGLTGELEDKAINVAKFIRNLEITANAIKKAEVDMAKRRKAYETRVQWLEDYLKSSMEATGIRTIECPHFKLSIAKNPPALDLFDSQAVPGEYKHTETVTTENIDKAAIKAALSSGQTITGARLVQGSHLVIK
jgi:hypothetical protein